jgi:hypothetical protein
MVGICRSTYGNGELVEKSSFLRRENFKACRTLFHVGTDEKSSKEYFNLMKILLKLYLNYYQLTRIVHNQLEI